MCGLGSTPKAPKIPPPPPVEPTPVFQAGAEGAPTMENEAKRGKDSLRNKSVGLGIPLGG